MRMRSIVMPLALVLVCPASSAVAQAQLALQRVARGFVAPVHVLGDPLRPERL